MNIKKQRKEIKEIIEKNLPLINKHKIIIQQVADAILVNFIKDEESIEGFIEKEDKINEEFQRQKEDMNYELIEEKYFN